MKEIPAILHDAIAKALSPPDENPHPVGIRLGFDTTDETRYYEAGIDVKPTGTDLLTINLPDQIILVNRDGVVTIPTPGLCESIRNFKDDQDRIVHVWGEKGSKTEDEIAAAYDRLRFMSYILVSKEDVKAAK